MATRGISITNELRDTLLDGEYPGGARLNEVDLAEQLNVSRTPIRAALSTLAAEGLLVYRPNCGYMVQSFTTKDVVNIYAVRGILESLCVRQAAEAGLSDAHHGKIHKVLTETEELLRQSVCTDEVREHWLELNSRFHEVLLDACDNAYLADQLRKSRAIPLLKQMKFRSIELDEITRSHSEHQQIFSAIIARQVTRAQALAEEHIHRSTERAVDMWRLADARKLTLVSHSKAA
jgi:GntR family transcriptional regulator of vanillate catabolism